AQRARQKYRLASQKCDRAACPPEVSPTLSEVRSPRVSEVRSPTLSEVRSRTLSEVRSRSVSVVRIA
ncbi:hypothetical protein ACOKW7_10445, partial [Limnospira platensis CENA597]|uniref:hypothetical protein n=1 Tax=Limnospira platensis TaxID=118562 RepID=UPI003DA0A625